MWMPSRRRSQAVSRKARVLSHDLLEGIFARAGLVSDVEVFEDFPSRYDVAASRQHRWARGDWQLLPWIIGRGSGDRRRPWPDGHSAAWPLETRRQPSPHAVGPGKFPRPRDRMGPAAPGRRLALERLRSVSFPVDRIPASRRTRDSASLRNHDRQPLPRISSGSQSRLVAVRPASGAARAPGLADGRRNRSDAVQTVSASTIAGMGDRRSGGFRSGTQACRLLSANGRRCRVGCYAGPLPLLTPIMGLG